MIEWMGRYRPLVEQLVLNSHEARRAMKKKGDLGDGIWLNAVEWQVLEYVYEHEEDEKMAHIYERIGLAQSSFSKCAKTLSDYGLIARYHKSDNRKEVIIKITDRGRKLYERFAGQLADSSWGDFFRELDALSDEDLEHVIRAMVLLNRGMPGQEEPPELIEIK